MQKGLFIIVNYGFADLTIQLLKNLYELQGVENFRIAVADNSEDIREIEKLNNYKNTLEQPSLLLYKSTRNLGYFGAVDFVLKKLETKAEAYKYVIVSNNDVEIRDSDFFKKLMALNEDAAVIAPDIISVLTGKHHNPHFLKPLNSWQKFQYRLLFSGYAMGWLLYHTRMLFKSFKKKENNKMEIKKQEIFSAYGAFIIFKEKYFKSGGKIDHGYFLYGEETSVSAQCSAMNLKILCCPKLVVFHNEHTATQSRGFKRKIYKMQKNAYKYIKSNYPGFY